MANVEDVLVQGESIGNVRSPAARRMPAQKRHCVAPAIAHAARSEQPQRVGQSVRRNGTPVQIVVSHALANQKEL